MPTERFEYLALTDNPFSAFDLVNFVKSLQNYEPLEELHVDVKHQLKFCQDVVTENISYNVISRSVVKGSSRVVTGFGKLIVVWLYVST